MRCETRSLRAAGATSNGPEAPGTPGARRLRSRYPEPNSPRKTTFTDVGVKKKSFCGSINSDKPCLHVDFGKFGDANVPAIEALIGSRYVTLNNSIQDKSYIKQTLGYRIAGHGGVAQFAMQLRPGVRQRNADRPRDPAASTAPASSSMPSR